MDAIKIVGFFVSALSSYMALLYKLSQVRRSWRDSGYRSLVTALVFQCATFTMGAVALSSDKFLGINNLAILFMHLSAVAMCVSALIVLLVWAAPLSQVKSQILGWLLAGIVLDVVLVVLFFAGDVPGKPKAELTTGSRDPVILAYLLLFIVSQAIPCVVIIRQCPPYARMTQKPWLRRALRMLTASVVVLFLYCVARTVNILSPLFGIDIGRWQIASSVLSAIGIVLISVSLTMPSWGVHVSNLLEWRRNHHSYRALYPLWHSLYEASPGIALEPPSSSFTDLHFRLHRRVVEIRDGWRALRPYMDEPATQAQAAADDAPTGDVRQAAIEAMKIKQAIRAKESGCSPVNGRDVSGFGDHNAKTFDAEVSWLTQVARAYRRLE